MRIGFGRDIHPLVENRDLILGGVHIPYEKGLMGHSDADVLLHAIIDALLGASSMGDIGRHFPDTDDAFKDISSGILLRKTYEKILDRGYKIVNLDSVLVAEAPKLAPFILDMEKNIASMLATDLDQISIKATTNEGIGELGKGLAIEAQVILLLEGGK